MSVRGRMLLLVGDINTARFSVLHPITFVLLCTRYFFSFCADAVRQMTAQRRDRHEIFICVIDISYSCCSLDSNDEGDGHDLWWQYRGGKSYLQEYSVSVHDI